MYILQPWITKIFSRNCVTVNLTFEMVTNYLHNKEALIKTCNLNSRSLS